MEGVTQYQCIKNNIFGDLLDQPKDHGIIEIVLQRNDNVHVEPLKPLLLKLNINSIASKNNFNCFK